MRIDQHVSWRVLWRARLMRALSAGGFIALSSMPALASAPANLGAQIAHQGLNSVPACDLCHGSQGEGNLKAGYPVLAGVDADYLREQMGFYAQGERKNALMQLYAKSLSLSEIRAVSAYYAALPAQKHVIDLTRFSPSTRRLLTQGSSTRAIPSCFSCHGDQGHGSADGIPPIAGQPAFYFIDQMNAWKTGQRIVKEGDPMAVIAKSLTRDEIIELAHILQN